MTLILALDCADGLILAADSQATIGTTGQPLKGPVQKIACPWSGVAWGGSGPNSVIQCVEHALISDFPAPGSFDGETAWTIRTRLCGAVSNAVRATIAGYLQAPGSTPWTSFLFVGCATDGPYILEVGPDLLHHDHIDAGYAAIGSGDIFPYFALAGLAHFSVRTRAMLEAKLIAYRVMDDAIRVAAEGLGPPIQMIEIPKPNSSTASVAARKLSAEDIRILGDKVGEWNQVESETLAQIVGLTPGETGEESEREFQINRRDASPSSSG